LFVKGGKRGGARNDAEEENFRFKGLRETFSSGKPGLNTPKGGGKKDPQISCLKRGYLLESVNGEDSRSNYSRRVQKAKWVLLLEKRREPPLQEERKKTHARTPAGAVGNLLTP